MLLAVLGPRRSFCELCARFDGRLVGADRDPPGEADVVGGVRVQVTPSIAQVAYFAAAASTGTRNGEAKGSQSSPWLGLLVLDQ